MPGVSILSYGGYTFSSGNFSCDIDWEDARGQWSTNPLLQTRFDAASFFLGHEIGPRTIPAQIMYSGGSDIETALWTILGVLRPRDPTPRPLVLTLPDGTTQVTIDCTVTLPFGLPTGRDLNVLPVTFIAADPVLRAASVTTDGPTSFAAAGSRTFTVAGFDEVNPTLKLSWSVQRPTPTSTIGWGYRRQITAANTGARALHNVPVQLGPIDHAALVTASKSQADGDDLCVFNDKGERVRKIVSAPNTKATFIEFVIDELAAGASRTYDVGYGNSAATHNLTLNGFPYSYFGSPTIDTTAQSGTATAGTTSTMSTGVTVDTNQFVGGTIMLTSAGTAIAGQYRRVLSHTTPGVYTVSRLFTSAPTSATTYVIINGPFMGDGGQASATSASSLTDSSQVWNPGEWIGATVEAITLGTGGATVLQTGIVTANTATVLTVGSWVGGTPSSTAIYRVYSRNANWRYAVEQVSRSATNFRGRYRLSAGGSKPSNRWVAADGAPAAWSPFIYNPGAASMDFNQPRFTGIDVGGGDIDWFAILNASLARKDGANLVEEGFANGLELYVPMGILGIRHDFQIKNPGGLARAVFGTREQSGEDWSLYKEYSTTQPNLTTVATAYYDLTAYGTPLHVMAALTSVDDATVPDTQTGTAILRDGAILDVRVDPRTLTLTDLATATEDIVYDYALTIRRGGATEAIGDDLVRLGGDEHHVFVTAGQELWVGPIGDVPLAARIYSALETTNILGTDAFTAAGGTALETYNANWIKHSSSGAGSATIDNNRVHNTNDATAHLYYRNDWTPPSADYDVASDVVMRSDNNLSSAGVAARINTSVETYYFANYQTSDDRWHLYKVVAGVFTSIGESIQTLTVDQAYRLVLSVRGSAIKVYVDGVVVITVNNTDITAAGRAGLRVNQAATSTVGVHLDNWAAYQGGDHTYVRDVPNGMRLYSVDANYANVATRVVSSEVLPLPAGSQTYRVVDEEGNQGTVEVKAEYFAGFV